MEIYRIVLTSLLIILANLLGAQIFTNYTTTNSGLPDNYINGGVAIDQNNVKWFATGNGVARYDDVTWTVYTTIDGLTDSYTTCIAVDANNNIWVGTDVGVNVFDGVSWTSYTTADGLPTNSINDIRGDLAGNVWFATYSGLSKFDGTSFTNYTTADGLPIDFLTNLSSDAQDNIWIGTIGAGLSKFDGTTFTNFGSSSNIIDTNITAVLVDHNDNKWAGTFYGISVYNSSDVWVADYTVADGLYGDQVRDIEEDSQGNIWFGLFVDYLFDGGVTKFDGTNWVSYSVPDGLIDVQVKRLAIDDQDNVWIATGNGVSKLSFTTEISEVNESSSFQVYPNPVYDQLHIDCQLMDNNECLTIYNITGEVVYQSRLDKYSIDINLPSLETGVYYLELAGEKKKIIHISSK